MTLRSGLRRKVIDGPWLRSLMMSPDIHQLDATGWASVLTHAGLRPLLALEDSEIGDPALARALDRVRTAGRHLERTEEQHSAIHSLLPSFANTDEMFLSLAAIGVLASLGPWNAPNVTTFALAIVGLIALLRSVHIRTRSGTPKTSGARTDMAAAVAHLAQTTWVSRAGDHLFENAPHADELRIAISRLDQTVDRARVRGAEMERLERELVAINHALGRTEDDPDLIRLRRGRATLDAELTRVSTVRASFGERLLACEGHMERLRLLARRHGVQRRLASLTGDLDALAHVRADAEVDIPGFDAQVEALASEVVVVERQLAATVEVAALESANG